MEAIHFRRWLGIKACLRQNEFWTEKKKIDEGYDLIQKYCLAWDVMTHNMNQLIDKGGDLTMDDTTWPNSSYTDIQGCLQGKKTGKGGQHVLLLDSKKAIYICMDSSSQVSPFTATGPAEVFGGHDYTSHNRCYQGSNR
jgi:hypothetical protein